MSDRLLIAGELGSRHGAAAVLVADPANRRWLGHPDHEGDMLLLTSGAVCTVPGEDLDNLSVALGGLGIAPGALLASDKGFGVAPPGYLCLDLSEDLAAARMRKDAEEIERISAAASLASIGQEAVRAAAAEGVSETEMWKGAQAAMGIVGKPDETLCDLLVGSRTAAVDGFPGAERAGAGDPVLFDLAPMSDSYWADSCATFVVGNPSARLRARHDAVRAALEVGIEAARPGLTAGELDALVRARLDAAGLACPHHIGHGVGTAPQEPPFLLPQDPTVLEEGMTIAIEPGAYGDGFGIRLEHLVLIEADGARPLTTHSLNLT